MIEAKIIIEAPELSAALNNLASALGGAKLSQTAQVTTAAQTQPSVPTQQPPVPTQAITPQPGQMPAPVTTAQPAQPAPGVPLAEPPKYTVEQIMAAGATLMDAGKVNELMNLLHSFGVQAVMDLKPEQLGAFATAMRELGAKI